MSKASNKKIACIFEEEQVFLTKSGCFYGYENRDGKFICRRLNTLEINRFLYRIKDDAHLTALFSMPKAKKPLPRKCEEVVLTEM